MNLSKIGSSNQKSNLLEKAVETYKKVVEVSNDAEKSGQGATALGKKKFFIGYIGNAILIILGFLLVTLFFSMEAVSSKCATENPDEELPENTLNALFFAFAFYIIVSFIISCIISRSFNQPVNRIADALI